MKLYFSPGSCSMAEHIALAEAGLPFEAVRVDLRTGLCNGEPFKALNPKWYVPAIQLADGRWLTEGVALLSCIADLKPEASLLPANGTWERLSQRLDLVDQQLRNHEFLLGPWFSAADAYLFTVLNWAGMLKRSLERWLAVTAYMSKVRQRQAVMSVPQAEGLKV